MKITRLIIRYFQSIMRSAKLINNDLIREIYAPLERNGDLTETWREAKRSKFVRVLGRDRTRSGVSSQNFALGGTTLRTLEFAGPFVTYAAATSSRTTWIRMPGAGL